MTKNKNQNQNSIAVTSQTIVKKIAEQKLLHYLKLIDKRREADDTYPVYIFETAPEIYEIIKSIKAENDGKADRSIDDPVLWESYDGSMFEEYESWQKINTRSLDCVQKIIKANLFNHIVSILPKNENRDRRVFRFASDPIIQQIKNEHDAGQLIYFKNKNKGNVDC